RRAAISSFGISGTNAHVIIEQPPTTEETNHTTATIPVTVLPLSARAAGALAEQGERLAAHLTAGTETATPDLGFSLATTRSALDRRAVVVAGDAEGLRAGLAALASGGSAPTLVRSAQGEDESSGKLAFLFTGQGSQRPGMGRELYDAHPVFAEALDAIASTFDRHLDRPLLDIVFSAEGSAEAALLDETAYTQAALFAIEVALFRLAESWGLRPDGLLGHSIGELAAAHVAGVLSLADACTLVAARGRLMQALPTGGAMLSVLATEEQVAAELMRREHQVAIAAVNGPASTVISGDADTVAELDSLFTAQGFKTRRLRVSHAFHSPHMDPMLNEFRTIVAELSFQEPQIEVTSNVTGRTATAEELTSPDYWVRHVREAVRFHDGLTALADTGFTTFLELGPDAVLTALAQSSLDSRPGPVTTSAPTLRRGRPEAETFTVAVAEAHVRGADVDWSAVYAGSGARRVELPTYPFQRQRFWMEAPDTAPAAGSVEARFWDAVEREDLKALTATLGAEEAAALGEALPVLASWRRRHATQAAPEAAAEAGAEVQTAQSLAAALASVSGPERGRRVLDLVRGEIAAALRYSGKEAVEPRRSLKELGFDSLAAVTLRNRLNAATGLALPVTLVFDHPTPADLAAHMAEALAPETSPVSVDDELERLGDVLAAADGQARERAAARLQELLTGLGAAATPATGSSDELAGLLQEAGDDDLFDLIDSELGSS
ncbi:acyltransferase domain-containing protein, partial [Streptomyces sp. AP-93]|uniref:acyltransferase domain-containing protein n=1 Tax=Streptomyces sp. AP-93 TaxID=2929048 RepID=UPI001FAE7946